MDSPRITRAQEQIRACLDDYKIQLSGPTVIGLSGGKDSTLLTLLLALSGIDVRPVIVDMAYPRFDSEAVRLSAERLGINATILHLRNDAEVASISPNIRAKITDNFVFLDSSDCRTPCGACSQNKRAGLAHVANKIGSKWILYGHHRDDFIATLLKDYFVHLYYRAVGVYDPRRFEEFVASSTLDLDLLRRLIGSGEAASMALVLPLSGDLKLARPLAYLSESEIVAIRDEFGIETHGSGCSHSAFSDNSLFPPTKREIVHADLTRRLADGSLLGTELFRLVEQTLTSSGRSISNPRATRDTRMPRFEKL